MSTSTEIKPCLPLQPYVRCFVLRKFDTKGFDIEKPIHALHECGISFTIKGIIKIKLSGSIVSQTYSHSSLVVGLQTSFKGAMVLNGVYSIFCIKFKPNGLFNICGIPLDLITNRIPLGSEIFGPDISILENQLEESKSIEQMACYAENFLLNLLLKKKMVNHVKFISKASDCILLQGGYANIQHLAKTANMSMRSFERNFTEQVGISPKLFARITRFNDAVELKLSQPDKNWTAITYLCNYHDQTHLIKDFKSFSGETPFTFFGHLVPENQKLKAIVKPSF